MRLRDKIEQIERVHLLILKSATGSPKQLAYKLNLSERAVYKLINQLKSLGGPIYYSKEHQSYCYSDSVDFNFGYLIKDPESQRIIGGRLWLFE